MLKTFVVLVTHVKQIRGFSYRSSWFQLPKFVVLVTAPENSANGFNGLEAAIHSVTLSNTYLTLSWSTQRLWITCGFAAKVTLAPASSSASGNAGG